MKPHLPSLPSRDLSHPTSNFFPPFLKNSSIPQKDPQGPDRANSPPWLLRMELNTAEGRGNWGSPTPFPPLLPQTICWRAVCVCVCVLRLGLLWKNNFHTPPPPQHLHSKHQWRRHLGQGGGGIQREKALVWKIGVKEKGAPILMVAQGVGKVEDWQQSPGVGCGLEDGPWDGVSGRAGALSVVYTDHLPSPGLLPILPVGHHCPLLLLLHQHGRAVGCGCDEGPCGHLAVIGAAAGQDPCGCC